MVGDPLENLLLDAEEVDRTLLARALQGVLGIDKVTGKIIFQPGFNKLTARQKVIGYLLGKKVSKLLGKVEAEITLPKDIMEETGIPKGTINPNLRELFDERLISQTKEGEYYINSHQIHSCVSELETKGNARTTPKMQETKK
jgi:hypothetical protein